MKCHSAYAPLVLVVVLSSVPAKASETAAKTLPVKAPEPQSWSFAGLFGTYDAAQLRRGFQVYREGCSACHSLSGITFRNLGDPGGPHLTDDEVRALAESYEVTDGPNDKGEMVARAGQPSDHLPSPFVDEKAAAEANGGIAPPDLTFAAKSNSGERGPPLTLLDLFALLPESGPDYLYALLTSFAESPPPGLTIPDGAYYNPYFRSAPFLRMPPTLADDVIQYNDGSPQTVDQYSRDVAAFLMWAADPSLVARKRIRVAGIAIILPVVGMLDVSRSLPTSLIETVLGKSGAAAHAE